MKTLLRQAVAVAVLIALTVTLLPASAFAEVKANRILTHVGKNISDIHDAATTQVGAPTDRPERPKQGEIWDGSIATGFAGGSGTESDPYLISNGAELAYLAQQVNSGTSYSDTFFKLTNDIWLNDTSDWESWGENTAPSNSWTAIGTRDNYFAGSFDGGGYAVRGVYINKPETDYQGLFGYVKQSISNLGVVESYIKGDCQVGGVVGYCRSSWGGVSNCYNAGTVTGNYEVGGVVGYNYPGTISNCYNVGAVSGKREVGGVVGVNYNSTVINCYNTGSVSGEDTNVGGIVGQNTSEDYNSYVTNCYNIGSVSGNYYVGGVVGWNVRAIGPYGDSYEKITSCYNTGSVSGESSVGGVVGGIDFGGQVTNCYNIGNVSGGDNSVGGVVGSNSNNDTVTNCYYCIGSCTADDEYGTALTSEQMTHAESFVGFDFETVWTMDGNPEYPYPELSENIHVDVEIVPTEPGDVNGDGNVTMADAIIISRMALGLTESIPVADFNGDGSVNMQDAILTARKALNLI